MAREAVDKHLKVAGALVDPRTTPREKLRAVARAIAFYAVWFPSLWLTWFWWPRFGEFRSLARHVRFAARASGKLARSIFYGILVFRGGLERRQGFLFRIVDIAMELFAMTAVVARARQMRELEHPAADEARMLADLFCLESRATVSERFHALWRNRDALKDAVGRGVLQGRQSWLEQGIVGLGRPAEDLAPRAPDLRSGTADGHHQVATR